MMCVNISINFTLNNIMKNLYASFILFQLCFLNLLFAQNVGIGTATPGKKLEIYDNINSGHIQPANGLLRLNNSENTTCPGTVNIWDVRVGNCGQLGITTYQQNATPFFNILKASANQNTASSGPIFSVCDTAPLNTLMLLGSGNVGIGMSNPDTRLKINGALSSVPYSLNAGAAISIPENQSIIRIADDGNITANAAISLNPKEGQFLTILNNDAQTVTFASAFSIPASTGIGEFKYINGAWWAISITSGNSGNDWTKENTVSTPAVKSDNQYVTGKVGIGDFSSTSIAHKLHIIDDNNAAVGIYQYNDNDGANIRGYRARGTVSVPTALLANDPITRLSAFGYNGSAFVGARGQITIDASENWTATATGTQILFRTTANTTTTPIERMRISNTGNVGIGTTSPGAALNVIHQTYNTTPTKPSGNWAAIIENNQDASDSRHGLSVVTRWGGSESKIFEAASYWSGGAQAYTPVLTVLGNRKVGIGTDAPANLLEIKGGHSNSQIRLFSDLYAQGINGVNTAVMTLWASEPSASWTGVGIGNNIYNTTSFPRLTTTRGGSYMRLLDNQVNINVVSSTGTDIDAFSVTSGAYGQGGIKVGQYHTLNSNSNSWLYVGDQSGSIYGGRGIAMGILYSASAAYMPFLGGSGNVFVMADNNGTLYKGSTVPLANLPSGTMAGIYVYWYNNCSSAQYGPVYPCGQCSCPSGWTWTKLAARWDGANEKWVGTCIKN
jgi:hypothetical protein